MTTYTLEYEHFGVGVEEVGDEDSIYCLLVDIYFKGELASYMLHKRCPFEPEELDRYIDKLNKKCEIMAVIVSFEKRYGSCYNEIDAIGEDDYEELADKLLEVLG